MKPPHHNYLFILRAIIGCYSCQAFTRKAIASINTYTITWARILGAKINLGKKNKYLVKYSINLVTN